MAATGEPRAAAMTETAPAPKKAPRTANLRGPWKPGQSGNPKGRTPGSRNKVTTAVEELLAGEAEMITRKVISKAKGGNLTAIKLILDRIAPPRKDRPVAFKLPKIEGAGDAAAVMAAIVNAVAAGELSPGEAAELGRLVDAYARVTGLSDIEMRLARLEGMLAR